MHSLKTKKYAKHDVLTAIVYHDCTSRYIDGDRAGESIALNVFDTIVIDAFNCELWFCGMKQRKTRIQYQTAVVVSTPLKWPSTCFLQIILIEFRIHILFAFVRKRSYCIVMRLVWKFECYRIQPTRKHPNEAAWMISYLDSKHWKTSIKNECFEPLIKFWHKIPKNINFST